MKIIRYPSSISPQLNPAYHFHFPIHTMPHELVQLSQLSSIFLLLYFVIAFSSTPIPPAPITSISPMKTDPPDSDPALHLIPPTSYSCRRIILFIIIDSKNIYRAQVWKGYSWDVVFDRREISGMGFFELLLPFLVFFLHRFILYFIFMPPIFEKPKCRINSFFLKISIIHTKGIGDHPISRIAFSQQITPQSTEGYACHEAPFLTAFISNCIPPTLA